MSIHYEDATVTLHEGDCLDVLRALPDASVDAVVTDPPYGLEFMGKEWDGADGFRRSLNPNDAGRDNAFGRTSRTSPEYRTASKAAAGMSGTGYTDGANRIERPSFMGSTNPKCLACNRWQRGANPCRCEAPEWTQERLVRLHSFQEWCEAWSRECLRVLKPGGHMLAFGGTRTSHRLACAIEDAGFDIRDSIAWLHGQGFPKNLNASKALDAVRCRCEMGELIHDGDVRGVRNAVPAPTEPRSASEVSDVLTAVQREGARAGVGPVGSRSSEDARPLRPATRSGQPGMEGRGDVQAPEGELRRSAVRPLSAGVPTDGTDGRLHHGAPPSDGSVGREDAHAAGVREPHQPRPAGQQAGEPGALPEQRRPQAWGGWPVCERCSQPVIPDGLGTAAKPAHEPIVVARKPLAGTVAANVLAHGTGALNIDGCRVASGEAWAGDAASSASANGYGPNDADGWEGNWTKRSESHAAGRWPANVVLDEQMAGELDAQSGTQRDGLAVNRNTDPDARKPSSVYGAYLNGSREDQGYGGEGGASRFFYVAKADASERVRVNGTAHPTVKPLALMRWLVRLVTPPGGTVLEPFAGSGTTVEACILEGLRCVAIERETDYLPLIQQRIHRRRDPVAAVKAAGDDGGLFDLLDDDGAA